MPKTIRISVLMICSLLSNLQADAWDMPIALAAGAHTIYDTIRNNPWTMGVTVLSAAGVGYWLHKKMQPRGPQKQVKSFFASKAADAALIEEPVEWPVKAVYANNIFGLIAAHCAGVFGGYVTRREGRLKNDSALTDSYIRHYLLFYKDHINMDEYVVPPEGFATFNDWFIRQLKNPEKDRPLDDHHHAIASPADAKVIVIPNLHTDTHITIKEQQFDVAKFLGNAELARAYEGGVMMIFRLSPYNYHRYHFPFDCQVDPEQYIDGKYHSVNPRAFVRGIKPLTENKRSYQVLKPVNGHAPVVMVQVGATAVASIVNHFMDYSDAEPQLKPEAVQAVFNKGAETGYFQFGGSTVVLLFPQGTIETNPQIVENSLNGYETAVKVRETVAYWKKPN